MNDIEIPLYQVDAFTSEPFKGNPAGVCLIEQELPSELMLNIAKEMNLSETAFPLPDGDDFNLRWFTPGCEVPLCGHATLATSHVLFEEIGLDSDEINYSSLSGPLKAIREQGGIRLDFPLNKLHPVDPPFELFKAMRIEQWEDVEYCDLTTNLLVRVGSYEELMAIKPDFSSMINAKTDMTIDGVILTTGGNDKYDFISRYLAPWVGVNEDPVTGLAHTMLTDYWSRNLGKDELKAFQASQRGGEMIVRRAGDRAHLIGNAVTIFKTTIRVSVK